MSKYLVKIRNYKNIDDFVQVFETGNLYLVKGRNNIGKTSVIKAISSAFNATNLNSNPIGQNGESSNIDISFEKDGINFKLKYLLEEKNGKVVDSIILISDDNQKIINKTDIRKLLSFNDFSVDQFFAYGLTAEGRRKQADILKTLLPEKDVLELDLIEAKINPKNGILFKERAVLNERYKTLETITSKNELTAEELSKLKELSSIKKELEKDQEQLNSFGDIGKDIALLKEKEDILSYSDILINNKKELYSGKAKMFTDEITSFVNKIKELKAKLSKLPEEEKAEIDIINNSNKTTKEEVEVLKQKVGNINTYNTLLEEVDRKKYILNNSSSISLINKYKEQKENKLNFDKVSEELKAKNEELQEERKRKNEIFEKSDIDIPELTIVENECMYVQDGLLLPFTEEHVSYATGGIPVIKMLMRINKNTPIILLGKSAEYDDENKKKILELASENDFIVIGDEVDSKAENLAIKIEEFK